MNARAFLAVPAALALVMLAGCGVSERESGDAPGSGSGQVRMPSTEVCNGPAWIRDRAPEGLCTEPTGPVEDDLSPLKPAR